MERERPTLVAGPLSERPTVPRDRPPSDPSAPPATSGSLAVSRPAFCFVPSALELAELSVRDALSPRFVLDIDRNGSAVVTRSTVDVVDAVASLIFDLTESVPPGREEGRVSVYVEDADDCVAIVASLRLWGPGAASALAGAEAQLDRLLGEPCSCLVDAERLGARVEWTVGTEICLRLLVPCVVR